MNRGVIDGVTVLWHELPGPLTAELSFGCGHRDEEIDTIGLTHFVQLLASPTELHAGITSHLTTSFTAGGPPDQIVSELAEICSALTCAPDPDRMAEVAIEAEPGDRFSGLGIDSDLRYPFAALLSRRFGPHGLGLVRWPTVDYSLFTAEMVRAQTRRYFVAANAVLTLTGQPPEGLRLPLPQGAKPVREARPVGSAPLWYQDEVDGAGISFRAETGPLYYLVSHLVSNELDGSLGVLPEAMLVDGAWQEAGFTIRSKADNAAEAIEQTWAQLRRLASSGPTRSEIEAALSAWESRAAEAAIAVAKMRTAVAELQGPADALPPAEGDVADFEMDIEQELFGASESFGRAERDKLTQVAPHRVQRAVADWLRGALIVVPRGARLALDGVAESPCPVSGHTPTGEVFKPSLLQRWRGRDGQIVVNSSGMSIVDQQGTHYTGVGDLVVIRDEREVWVGDAGHGCLHDVSSFGRAGDQIWQSVSETRRRVVSV